MRKSSRIQIPVRWIPNQLSSCYTQNLPEGVLWGAQLPPTLLGDEHSRVGSPESHGAGRKEMRTIISPEETF